ncbi:hypothetical protein [uncultured Arcobacter sp.]|uniref:hypothetical protein n=1 Tax=uncultured Arcobacter sp. TaxID=165434 RepID=UPI002610D428|nr:hypothetical protein [uncultured Arcobacter sp.]
MKITDFKNLFLEMSDEGSDISPEDYADELHMLIYEFMSDLDETNLPEEQQDMYYEIMDGLGDYLDVVDGEEDDEEDMEEAVAPRKNRISRKDWIQRKKEYRKHKNKIKLQQKRYRKTTSYKKYQKKAKRLSKIGKTSTGKRQTTRIRT